MSISNYQEQVLMQIVHAGTPLFIKLHIGDPGEDCADFPAANTTRVSQNFASPVSGSMASNAVATWTNVPNAETYSHISLWSAITAGNPIWHGALTTSRAVEVGDNFSIASGALTVTLN